MFEALLIFVYIAPICGMLLAASAIYYIGVFVLFCLYKRNGGKYNIKKFIKTRKLDL